MKPQDAQKVFDREFPRLLRVTKSLVQIDMDRVRRENEEKSLAELDDLIAAQQRLDRLTEEDIDHMNKLYEEEKLSEQRMDAQDMAKEMVFDNGQETDLREEINSNPDHDHEVDVHMEQEKDL